ncbi:uncharacterized protein LOC129220605 [Uloborus diversus]|uniref:uncharacterized protein LOC129220605 n=1 Tax=Uloborus diversus TaxID=327109 RepID=UPI00240A1521|nr:uncharacterized protein LOC129220605 [Uloborus diversus]
MTVSQLLTPTRHKLYHECLKALLAAGFSPDSLNRCELPGFPNLPYVPDRETTLSFAILKRNEIAIAILLKAGASCNPIGFNTYHPLLRAISNPTLREFNILLEGGTDVNYPRCICTTNEVFLHCLLTSGRFLRPLLYHGCDPRPCLLGDREPFLNCSVRYLRRERVPLRDYLCLLLRIMVIDGIVQVALHDLVAAVSDDVKDMLAEIDSPSSLKQICSTKIRQHLYRAHGVWFPKLVSRLCLPSMLEDYVACKDILTS